MPGRPTQPGNTPRGRWSRLSLLPLPFSSPMDPPVCPASLTLCLPLPGPQVDQALAAGTDVVLRIDVQGAATVKALMPEAITVFVAAESQAKLVSRLAARKTETLVGSSRSAARLAVVHCLPLPCCIHQTLSGGARQCA